MSPTQLLCRAGNHTREWDKGNVSPRSSSAKASSASALSLSMYRLKRMSHCSSEVNSSRISAAFVSWRSAESLLTLSITISSALVAIGRGSFQMNSYPSPWLTAGLIRGLGGFSQYEG